MDVTRGAMRNSYLWGKKQQCKSSTFYFNVLKFSDKEDYNQNSESQRLNAVADEKKESKSKFPGKYWCK